MISIKDGKLRINVTDAEMDMVLHSQSELDLLSMSVSSPELVAKFCQYAIAKADLVCIMEGLLKYVDSRTAIKIVTESCEEFLNSVKEEKKNE